MKVISQSLIFLAIQTLWAVPSLAQVNFFASTKLLFAYPQYSGVANSSFSETGSGISGELQVDLHGIWLAPFGRMRAVYVASTQSFLDGASSVESDFTYLQGGFDLGANFFPMKRRKSGFNIYLGALLGLSYHTIQLDASTTTTSIPKSDQSVSTGYGGLLGAEFVLGGNSKNKWTLVTELTHRFENAKILGQSSFDLRNVTLSVGLGW